MSTMPVFLIGAEYRVVNNKGTSQQAALISWDKCYKTGEHKVLRKEQDYMINSVFGGEKVFF